MFVCVCVCARGYTEKTSIVVPPQNTTVNVGSHVTLQCNATTDQLERRKLKISWLLNGEKIEFGSRTNVAQYDPDKSLKITQAQVDNTGSYTCNASTELDWDAVTIRLTVRGIMSTGALVAVWYSAALVIGRLQVRILAGATSHQGLLSLPSLRVR